MAISANTKVEITLKLLIIGIVATVASISTVMAAGLGVLGWILSFTIGDVRKSNTDLQAANRDMINRANDINLKLTEQIGGLRTDFVKFTAELGDTNKSVTDLSGQVSDLKKQIQTSQVAWSDPKFIASVVENMRKQGVTGNVVIIPPR